MKQVAFVKSTGEIAYITTPGTDADFTDGHQYGEYVARDISSSTDPVSFIAGAVWHADGWYSRPPQPNSNYGWTGLEWQLDVERLRGQLRLRRDSLLRASDWRMLPDSPMSPEQKQDWADYRQALRDLAALTGDAEELENPQWPVPPQ